jgi:Spy/CpxP family protein refolding chaperone
MNKLWSVWMMGLLMAGSVVAQPYGMGPGMMGGGGGYGMGGPWMQGGAGGYGMGPGMMGGGYGVEALVGLDLSAQQRKQIAQIQEETAKSRWQLMGTMHEQDYRMGAMAGAVTLDEAAARKAFDAMAATQRAMFELSLSAHKRINEVLTPEQREKLRQYWGSR